MNKFKYPIFSKSLADYFRTIVKNHNDPIAKYLLTVDVYWNCLNQLTSETDQEIVINLIDALITEQISMLSIRENQFEISFLPKGKEPKYSHGNWVRENRQTGKPTKTVKKLIKAKFTDAEYEVFNNLLRACIENNHQFEIVSGDDIAYWYDEQHYKTLTGSLGDSCMKDVNPEFFDIYSDQAEMLILKDKDELIGRALVWTIDNLKYLDRIYVTKDYLVQKFIDYAIDNKWAFRQNNSVLSDGSEIEWYFPDDEYKTSRLGDLEIVLNRYYKYYPYMDSFRYLYKQRNSISTSPDNGEYIELSFTSGELGESYVCRNCGNEYNIVNFDDQEDIFYSNYLDDYLCHECAVWSDELDDWLPRDKCVQSKWSRYSYDWILEDSDNIIQINDEWWFTDAEEVIHNTETGEYSLKVTNNEQN